jgi:hypothetical protein
MSATIASRRPPTASREFRSTAPLAFQGGDKNLYRYVGNDPVNLTDPLGLSPYRQDFRRQTPEMPAGWRVHHTLQQADILKDRFWRERRIDVDDVRHLRGVDNIVHLDIGKMQDLWAEGQMRKLGILQPKEKFNKNKLPELWKRISLDEVIAFQKDMDVVYAPYWIKVGACEADVAKVQKRIGTARRINMFNAGQGNRAARLFPGLASNLGLLALIGATYGFAQGAGVVGPLTREQNDAWQEFMSHYNAALDDGLHGQGIDQNATMNVHASFIRYLQAIHTPEDAVTHIDRELSLHLSGQR